MDSWSAAKQGTFRGGNFIAPTLTPETREAWMDEALCAEVDTEMFFPEKGGSTKAAKSICVECPVAAECLAFALKNDERFGIWGGMSERERRRLRRGQPVVRRVSPVRVSSAPPGRPRRWWVPADTATLIRLHGEGKTDRSIAGLMERHPEMIAQRRRKLGLPRNGAAS